MPSLKPRTDADLEALLARIRQRLYTETLPALTSFWLKSLSMRGYGSRRWSELNDLFRSAIEERGLDERSREALMDVTSHLPSLIQMSGNRTESAPRQVQPVRTTLNPEGLAVYTARLLNEWMPVEVARMLLDDDESGTPDGSGIPVLAVAHGIERLLLRAHLSMETMEMLLKQELLSPEHVYPAELELLRDVVLSLLGRTSAPASSLLPATLLFAAPASHLAPNYREALRHAQVVKRSGAEEIHVPIAPAAALGVLNEEQLRIASIIVTMDGRWWQSEKLELGEQYFIVYRPGKLLRMEYTTGFTELRAPWPENGLRRENDRCLGASTKIFGREWFASKWEMDAERTWLHLRLSRALSMSEIVPGSVGGPWRLAPASVDMAWAALASALLISLNGQGNDAVEQLRNPDLIPLGRAIAEFVEAVMSRRRQVDSKLELHLASVRYARASVFSTYGRVPWKILPEPVRRALLRTRHEPSFLELLNDVFEGFPDTRDRPTAPSMRPGSVYSPQAAAKFIA